VSPDLTETVSAEEQMFLYELVVDLPILPEGGVPLGVPLSLRMQWGDLPSVTLMVIHVGWGKFMILPGTVETEEQKGQGRAALQAQQDCLMEEAAERVMERLLTTVVWSLAESQRAGQSLRQAVEKLNAVFRAEYGIDNKTLLALAAKEALRRMDTPLGRLQRGVEP